MMAGTTWKLTGPQRDEIVTRRAAGEKGARLAVEFGISRAAVSLLCKRRANPKSRKTMNAPSTPNRRLPREAEDSFRSGKAARAGLNKDWFCGQCGGYHPKGQVVCDGKQG